MITTAQLYSICNKHQFFTNGTIKQYDLLFAHNETNPPIRDLAVMIYTCSINYTLQEIINILEKETISHGTLQ